MRLSRFLTTIACGALIASPTFASAASEPAATVDPAALQTIKRDATDIAAGKYATKAALQAPAREIALLWAKTVPSLMADGSARVETKIANEKIAQLERDWQQAPLARRDARDVTSTIGDLIEATKPGAS